MFWLGRGYNADVRIRGSADVTTCKLRMLMRMKNRILPTRVLIEARFDLDSALKLPVLLWLSNELH